MWGSENDPLNGVSGDLPFRPVLEVCLWVGVAEEVPDVLERDTLGDQVRGRR